MKFVSYQWCCCDWGYYLITYSCTILGCICCGICQKLSGQSIVSHSTIYRETEAIKQVVTPIPQISKIDTSSKQTITSFFTSQNSNNQNEDTAGNTYDETMAPSSINLNIDDHVEIEEETDSSESYVEDM